MLGVDVVDVCRFRKLLERKPKIVIRLFASAERAYAETKSDPSERYAARFAAKEAVMKALGAGFGEVAFREVEVLRHPSGRPSLKLHGRAAKRAETLGMKQWQLSLSHTDSVAVAVVVAS